MAHFTLKGKVFMYDEDYNGSVIDKEKLKEYIYKTKQFTKEAVALMQMRSNIANIRLAASNASILYSKELCSRREQPLTTLYLKT